MNLTPVKPEAATSPCAKPLAGGVLAWSAGWRVLAVVPLLVLLWLAVIWAGLAPGPL